MVSYDIGCLLEVLELSTEDELIRLLFSFALRFPSRSRAIRHSLDEIVARKMMENHIVCEVAKTFGKSHNSS